MTTRKTKPEAAEIPSDATDTEKATKAPRGDKAGRMAGPRKKPVVKPAQGRAAKAAAPRKPRTDTKQAGLIGMLRRDGGVTIEEAVKAFGWQAHTVRGALYGALKKKLGLDITSEKVEGRGRVYRIGS
jgi:hypothetical protein